MILFYSDQHLRDFGSFPPFNTDGPHGMTKELWNIVKGFFWVADRIEELKPEMVINSGDIFHSNEYISVRTLHGASIAFERILQACAKVKCSHIILPGNHDIYSQGSAFDMVTSASILRGYGAVKSKPTVLKLKSGFRVGLVPYTHDYNEAVLSLADMSAKSDLMVTHLDFEGASYESGTESLSKLTPHFDVPVVSGHLHKTQKIGSVSYVGSLVQHRFGQYDLKNVGGVLLFDPEKPEDDQIKTIPNTASQHYLRIDLERILENHGKIPWPKEAVALQVFSDMALEDARQHLEGYDYVFLAKKIARDPDELAPVRFNIEQPQKILRDRISDDNPDALKDFDKVMKSWSET